MHTRDMTGLALVLVYACVLALVLALALVTPPAFGAGEKRLKRRGTVYSSGISGETHRSTGRSAGRGRSKAAQKTDPILNSDEAAAKELLIPASEQTTAILSTPATVLPNVAPLSSAIERSSIEFGLGLESYTPSGRVKMSGLDSYSANTLGSQWMPTLELRLLPLVIRRGPTFIQGSVVGFTVSASYARQDVELSTPTGLVIEGTKLHSLKTQAGVVGIRPFSMKWAMRSKLGLGRLDVTQASSSAYAQANSNSTFAYLGVALERSIGKRIAVYAGYERREPMNTGENRITGALDNWQVGVSGGLQ